MIQSKSLIKLPNNRFKIFIKEQEKTLKDIDYILELAQIHPSVSVTPVFSAENSIEQFLKGETNILFALEEEVKKIPDIQIHSFYESPIYLISQPDDPLTKRKRSRHRI